MSDLERLIALSEKAKRAMEAGDYIIGVQFEMDFRSAVAAWFRKHKDAIKVDSHE